MFCLFCQHYKGLDVPCSKDIKVSDIQRVMKCTDYEYNGECVKND